MLTVFLFNFDNYFDNPMVKYCVEHNLKILPKDSDVHILTIEDALKIIDENNLKHSKLAYNAGNRKSFIGDQLRLFISTQYDNFLYLDADVYVDDFNEMLQYDNCTELIRLSYGGYAINNGTFFHSNHDCRFNNYYYKLYNTLADNVSKRDNGLEINYCVFNQYPFEQDYENKISGDMHLIDSRHAWHFICSRFYRLKQRGIDFNQLDYTLNPDFDVTSYKGTLWKMRGCPIYRESEIRRNSTIYYYDTERCIMDFDTSIRLLKEQLEYLFGHEVKFNCID